MLKKSLIFSLLLAFGVLFPKITITDGDTIRINDARVRLHGIDAPEKKQTCSVDGETFSCGKEATELLRELVDETTRCIVKDQDRYKRVVAECFTGELNINEEMVRRGLALAYTRYSDDYEDEERAAKEKGLGVWKCDDFMNPEDYRRKQSKHKKRKPRYGNKYDDDDDDDDDFGEDHKKRKRRH